MPDDPPVDVLVLGGGPAGLTTALDLAQRGWEVVVLERSLSRQRRLCGEFLSGDGWAALEALDLTAVLETAGCPYVQGVRVTSGGSTWKVQVPGLGRGCTRRLLAQTLEAAAVAAGVRVVRGMRGRLGPGPSQGAASSASGTTGPEDAMAGPDSRSGATPYPAARVTVWAAGQSGAAALERSARNHARKRWLGVAVHGCPRQAAGLDTRSLVRLHAVPGGYVGVCAVEGGRVNVCALLSAAAVSTADPIEALYQMRLHNQHLDKELDDVTLIRTSVATVAGIDFGTRCWALPLSVGDAAAAPAPVLGQGLAAALCGGALLAGWVDRHLRGELDADQLRRGYRRAWETEFSRRLRWGNLLQTCLLSPGMAALGLAVMRLAPALGAALVRRTRGPLRRSCAPVLPRG